MSCETSLCWSTNAELSGDSRKDVNASIVMIKAGAVRACISVPLAEVSEVEYLTKSARTASVFKVDLVDISS